jgi:CheY-like chemotaxis protein
MLLVNEDKKERLKIKVFQKFHFPTRIIEAIDGEDTCKYLNNNISFNLIISDLNIPRMQGSEFLSALRSYPKDDNIPLVIMATCAFKNELQKCFILGISGYFTNLLK